MWKLIVFDTFSYPYQQLNLRCRFKEKYVKSIKIVYVNTAEYTGHHLCSFGIEWLNRLYVTGWSYLASLILLNVDEQNHSGGRRGQADLGSQAAARPRPCVCEKNFGSSPLAHTRSLQSNEPRVEALYRGRQRSTVYTIYIIICH